VKTLKLLLPAFALAAATLSAGQALNYAQANVEVKAGVLLIDTQRDVFGPTNRAPHVWGNLDRDVTAKPPRWTFVNPLGQTTMTQSMFNRWAGRPGGAPAVGTRLNKRSAAYWEVGLGSASALLLNQFDVLSLSVNGLLSLNTVEREKLRQYVDQGGVLWVDLIAEGVSVDVANPLPFPFDLATTALGVDANLSHPLLSVPNSFVVPEVASLAYPLPTTLVSTPVLPASLGGLESVLAWIAPDSLRMESVAGNSDGSSISVGRVGQGYLVLTTRGTSAVLNRGYNPAAPGTILPNTAFESLEPVKDGAYFAAAKFAVNLVSLGSQSLSGAVGSRRTGSTATDVAAPLLRRFSDVGGAYAPGAQPVLYKGRVVSVLGDRVVVYDARPDTDLDNDGDPDDGVQNPVGAQADVVWRSQAMGGRLSAPTLADVPDSVLPNPDRGGAAVTEQLWVASSDGRAFAFDLSVDPASPNLANMAPVATVAPPDAAAAGAEGPFPPAYLEGFLYFTDTRSADGQGRVWMVDPTVGTRVTSLSDWKIFSTARMPAVSAAAAVGYIPIQDSSGGYDKVLYVPSAPGSASSPRPASFASVWAGARGEAPVRRQLNGPNEIILTTRASFNQLPIYLTNAPSKLGVKITMLKPQTGDPFTQAELAQYIGTPVTQSANGELRVPIVGNPGGYDLDGSGGNPANTVGWRIDYHLDWGRAGAGVGQPAPDSYVRGHLELPDDPNFQRRIVGSPAIGPRGNVYVATSAPAGQTGGSFFNFKEDKARGSFSMVQRFDVYDALTFQLNGSSLPDDRISMQAAITDQDELVRALTFLDRPLRQMRIVSQPVVRGDTVYVMAMGGKSLPFGGGVVSPTGVLLAFEADPGSAVFEVEGQDGSFSLVQPDVALSTNKTQPDQVSQLQPSQFIVEPIPNSSRSRIVLRSLMPTEKGRIRDSINTSLPIIVRRSGQTDAVYEPEGLAANGRLLPGYGAGRFGSLRWYVTFNGFDATSNPSVAGSTLYIAGSSVLPSVIQGVFPPSFNGLIFAMDANLSPNDEFLRANTVRPWMLQMTSFLRNGPGIFEVRAANALKWPQFKGIESFDDLRIRILQAAIAEPRMINLAAGDGTVAVTSDTGLHAYSRADFLVADSGRIARFDASGNPLWATDQTFVAGEDGPVVPSGNGRQVSEPNRVYPAGQTGYWVVDSGNNRIVRIDASGRELRSIDAMRVDPLFRPDGLTDVGGPAGTSGAEQRALKLPKDVLVFETIVDSSVAGANPFSNPRPLEKWVHYLIADAGNFRALELVDRYAIDPATGRNLGVVTYADPKPGNAANVSAALGVLYWHSPEELSGKRYSYNSVARTSVEVGGTRRTVVALGFGNLEPGRATLGLDTTGQQLDASSGGGGVVLYDGQDSVLITEFVRPAIPQSSYLGETAPGSGLYDFLLPTIAQPSVRQKLVGLRSASLRYVDVGGTLRLAVMVAESTGVYELVEDPGNPGQWIVRWMLPTEAYVGMRRPRAAGPYSLSDLRNNPTSLRPMYARRLDSGDVLVVNGFVGRRFDNARFNGEVVLVDGSFGGTGNEPGYLVGRPNLGFNALSIKFELPPVQGVREIIAPVFAERQ
jgi:hypothetical protein